MVVLQNLAFGQLKLNNAACRYVQGDHTQHSLMRTLVPVCAQGPSQLDPGPQACRSILWMPVSHEDFNQSAMTVAFGQRVPISKPEDLHADCTWCAFMRCCWKCRIVVMILLCGLAEARRLRLSLPVLGTTWSRNVSVRRYTCQLGIFSLYARNQAPADR